MLPIVLASWNCSSLTFLNIARIDSIEQTVGDVGFVVLVTKSDITPTLDSVP